MAACQRKQAFETCLEFVVRKRRAVAFGCARQFLIGKRALEQVKKIVRVRQFGGSVDRGAILAEIDFIQFRLQSAQSGTEDHAELAGVVQADAQFNRGWFSGGQDIFLESDGQTGKQRAQFRLVQRVASSGCGPPEYGRRRGAQRSDVLTGL